MTNHADFIELVPTSTDVPLPLRHAAYWVKAAEYQAQRAITAHISNDHVQERHRAMEDQFFLTAIEKARRWLTILLYSNIELHDLKSSIQTFLVNTKAAKEMRDMREHDEDYLLDRGRHQQNADILLKMEEQQSQAILRMGFTSTIMRRNDGSQMGDITNLDGLSILLGGKVDIVAAWRNASNLANGLLALMSSIAPAR